MAADLLTALAALSLASAGIGAVLVYVGLSIHHGHKK
jgi:hypothetical protein